MLNTFKTNNTMKRLLTIGLMLVSAFALTNCAEEIAAPVQDDITVDGNIENITPPEEEVNIPFEVFATVGGEAETKTQNVGNGTYWVANDGISVFHKTGNKITHNKQFTISAENLASGLFQGGLNSVLGETNDWFFLYPYKNFKAPTTEEAGDYSSSGSTLTVSGVQIGAITLTNVEPGSKAHVVNEKAPMYGVKKCKNKTEAPEVTMQHLASIAAIKIVNNAEGGDIVVSNIEFMASEPIVGEFKLAITDNDQISYTATNASATARVELKTPTSLKYSESITVYVPVKPFDATNKELTIAINGVAAKGNGVSRTVKMDLEKLGKEAKFEAAKVTTLNVSVNDLSFHYEEVDPAASNLMGLKVQVFDKIENEGKWYNPDYKLYYKQGDAVTTENSCTTDVVINGKYVKAYIIGTESKVGKISIHGTARELISYMPMEFYAAAWNNSKAVMQVESITVHTDLTVAALMGHKLSLDYSTLTSMMDGSKITFNGLVPLEQITYDQQSHMVIMDEEPFHKPISKDKFNTLLQAFDHDLKDSFEPTFDGLKDAIENPGNLRSSYDLASDNLTAAEITAYCVWKKIDTKVSSSTAMSFAAALTGDVLKSPKGLFQFASSMPIDVVLTTLAKGGPEGATDNRLIFWGLNSPEVK